MNERVYKTDARIRVKDGKNYVSVTSILSLVHVRDYIDIWKEELISRFGERYYKCYMDEVADQGSVMHGLIEAVLRSIHSPKKTIEIDYKTPLDVWYFGGEQLMKPEWIKRFHNVIPYESWDKFIAWTRWLEQAELQHVDALELEIYSDMHRYSGRFDAILSRSIGKGLHDWKSSGYAASDKHKMQAAAYYYAHLESTGEALDYAAIVCCGMTTQKGWHETILLGPHRVDKKTKPENTVEYWYHLFQKHLAIAMPAIEKILSSEHSLPRIISIPTIQDVSTLPTP